MAADTARTLYIRYETGKDTVPGTYTGKLRIKKEGETLLSGDVSVRVRDVYYDEKTECLTMFGLGYDPGDSNPTLVPGPDSAPALDYGSDLLLVYAQYMLDNRLNPSGMPYQEGLLSEDAVEYMKNPRVTMTMISSYSLDRQYEIAVENDLLGKLNYGTFDEPHEMEHLGTILQTAKLYQKSYPGLRAMDCLNTDLPWKDCNIIEQLADVTTLFSPKLQLYAYDKGVHDSIKKYQRERGDTVIWYVCGSGDGDLNTVCFLPAVPGTDKRVLFWQQYQEEIDGILYWRVTFWNTNVATKYTVDVWADDYLTAKRKFPLAEEGPTDDGVLLYWHPETGMPVSTLGFESIRDGVEDFQLLKMVEAAVGREKVLSYVEQITTDPAQFIHYEDGSTPLLEGLKNQLFDLLDP